jgi:hypothetical protein
MKVICRVLLPSSIDPGGEGLELGVFVALRTVLGRGQLTMRSGELVGLLVPGLDKASLLDPISSMSLLAAVLAISTSDK